jgi:hypothetical protein
LEDIMARGVDCLRRFGTGAQLHGIGIAQRAVLPGSTPIVTLLNPGVAAEQDVFGILRINQE